MTRPFFTRRHEEPLLACGLYQAECDLLATYNAERGRGIVHDDEWREAMAEFQRRFDEATVSIPVPEWAQTTAGWTEIESRRPTSPAGPATTTLATEDLKALTAERDRLRLSLAELAAAVKAFPTPPLVALRRYAKTADRESSAAVVAYLEAHAALVVLALRAEHSEEGDSDAPS